MTDFIRNWIVSVTAAATLTALAAALIPAGPVKKASGLVLGLVLMLAVLMPVTKLDEGSLLELSMAYGSDLDEEIETFQNANTDIMESIIAERMRTYILDKANTLGLEVSAVDIGFVTDENGTPVPASVELTAGEYSGELAGYIETELGIGKDSQKWN